MKQMKKILALILALAMITAMLSACAPSGETVSDQQSTGSETTDSDNSSDTQDETTDDTTDDTTQATGDPIVIGLTALLTGTYAASGNLIDLAVKMAVEEVNEAGGVLGRPVEVICYDDQGDATYAVNVANKLVSDGVCAILGTNLTGTTKAVSPIFESAGIPYISSGSSASLIDENNAYFFRIAASDNEVVALGAQYMSENFGSAKIACIHDTNTYGQGVSDVLAEYTASIGAEYFEAGYNQGDTDLSGQILSVADFDPDYVFLGCQETEIAICIRQMYELGIDIPTMGVSSLGNKYCQDLLTEEEIVGKYLIVDVIPMSEDETIGAFYDAFGEKTGEVLDRNGAMFYAAFWCLMDAIERAGVDEPQAIRDALMETQGFPTVVGKLTSNEYGELQHNGIVAQITEGKVITIIDKIEN